MSTPIPKNGTWLPPIYKELPVYIATTPDDDSGAPTDRTCRNHTSSRYDTSWILTDNYPCPGIKLFHCSDCGESFWLAPPDQETQIKRLQFNREGAHVEFDAVAIVRHRVPIDELYENFANELIDCWHDNGAIRMKDLPSALRNHLLEIIAPSDVSAEHVVNIALLQPPNDLAMGTPAAPVVTVTVERGDV